jgi:hypothetical protein
MRITNAGGMSYCRWTNKQKTDHNIQTQTPIEFFQKTMQPIRDAMLQGQANVGCGECWQMEQHGKVSGRQKQLLKIGVQTTNFAKTLQSSPWIPVLDRSPFEQLPQDWQIDLGNFCNSACVFCSPDSSSRLANEYLQLGLINALPPQNWTDNESLLEKFFVTLEQTPKIKYMHFIGGETLITPAFAEILQRLIDKQLHQTTAIGFTTNLMVWPQPVIDLLQQFSSVHVGVSVEAFAAINEYVRWPADQTVVESHFDRWVQLCKHNQWYVQIRTTPTVLSIPDLLTVYDRAWQYQVGIESCNFLQEPAFMRPSVLPLHMRQAIIEQFSHWLDQHRTDTQNTIVNTRNPNTVQALICQDLTSYVNYLTNESDESWRLSELIAYLRRIESSRKNCILDCRPEYEKLFRSYGY